MKARSVLSNPLDNRKSDMTVKAAKEKSTPLTNND